MPLYNESLSVLALAPAIRLATANGNTIDRVSAVGNAYENVLMVILAGTITDGTHTVSVQHSYDGTTWVNVPAGQLVGSVPALGAAQSNNVYDLGVNTERRYLRVVSTVTGSPATGGLVAAICVLGDPSYLPAR